MSDVQIRELENGDEAAVLDAYRDAFGHARDAAAWRWAFTSHPLGRRVMLAVRQGTVLAQYAALPVRVWIDGEAQVFGQVVDTFVRRSLREGLGGSRLLVRTAEAFFETHGEDTFMWGSDFPHSDSTWPDSRSVIEKNLAGIPEAVARKVVCENVAKLYGIDLD